MIVIGLTGSIAMGKTTVANMFRKFRGVAVHCSDEAVHGLYRDPEVIELVREAFPGTYDSKGGRIDTALLLEELGHDDEKWDTIESIIHPFVRASQDKFIREQRALGTRIAVLDIPLLFETGAEQRVDYTVCVTAPSFIQEQRIAERISKGLITEENFRFRLSRQWPDRDKTDRADFIVHTGTDKAYTRAEVKKIIGWLLKEDRSGNGNENNRVPPHRL